jgi:uncharacterized pyridoxamine 5'-phosphate oxidase family protein
MNQEFVKINRKIVKDFSKDRLMALATSVSDTPNIRLVDTYYLDGCLYIATHNALEKMKEIKENNRVSLCTNLNVFHGEAFNIGHPLSDDNKELRELLIDAFKNWYFEHNDENDPEMCYMKIKLSHATLYFGKVGYEVDFVKSEVKKI